MADFSAADSHRPEPDFRRLETLIGASGLDRLRAARVAVIGLGGVGSYTVEALARSAIGTLILVDGDIVAATDFNRQLPATLPGLGRYKAEVLSERIAQINPACTVEAHTCFLDAANIHEILAGSLDYVVDAVDQVAAKTELAVFCRAQGLALISCLGMGNKLDPTLIEVADLAATSVCPLARVMRRELRLRGIEHLKVVYSREQPRTDNKPTWPTAAGTSHSLRQRSGPPPSSCAFVPPAAGLILASAVVRDLIG